MRFDTLNFTLVGVAALLIGVALFRSQAAKAAIRPKRPLGFQP